MAKYAIGTIIYENRVRRRITQEELSYGICTPGTLSKIENGMQMPRRKIYEGLMQRLGLQSQYYFLPVSREEMERSNLEYLITRKLYLRKYDIDSLLERYRTCGAPLDHMEEQFYVYASAMLLKDSAKEIERMTELLLEAILYTVPNFSMSSPKSCAFLSFMEITIINHIAANYNRLGKSEEAKTMLLYLKEYLEYQDIDLEEKAKIYPIILLNLNSWFGMEGRNELAYELSNTGIDFCIKYGNLTPFPMLVFNKGCSLAKMNRLEEAIPLFRQACTIFEALKDSERAELCRKEVQAAFSVDI